MNLSKPIKRESVVNTVLNRIKEALMKGEIKPGDKLPTEVEFSNKLNVSRTSIREAMQTLKALGVIDVRQGDGTYVVDEVNSNCINPLIFSLLAKSGSSKELVELRFLMEVGYTKLAIKIMNEEDLWAIKNAFEKHNEAVENGENDLGRYEMSFHYEILKATKNPFVIEIGQTVLKLFEASIRRTSKKNPEVAIKHHRGILEAIKKKDSKQAEIAIKQSFEIWGEHITD